MNYWNKIPLFRLLIPLLFGILTTIYSKFPRVSVSAPKYKWEQIKKECHKRDIPFYNVNTQGAYLFKLTSS